MKPFATAFFAPAWFHVTSNMRPNMRHLLALVTLLLLTSAVGFSETKEIVAEGAYHMGDGETPSVAESRALLQAKRLAVEQAGTYVESYSKVKHLQLTEDEIQVLASGLMEVTILDKKRSIAGDGFNFSVKIRAIVHPDKMEEMAMRVKEKSAVVDYKKVQEAYDNSQKEIEALKRQLSQAKNEQEKAKVEARITDEERSFQAHEWIEKGEKYWLNDQNDAAIEAYTKAIGLRPNHAKAYYLRGSANQEKKQYDEAIEDYDKAIALDPSHADAYLSRGAVFAEKRQYDKAVTNLQRACHLGDELGCTLMEQELKRKMLLEWDPLKAPEGFDFNKEYEKELKKLKQRH
jgi:tetratricopeptide (TPR) repeat protein